MENKKIERPPHTHDRQFHAMIDVVKKYLSFKILDRSLVNDYEAGNVIGQLEHIAFQTKPPQ